MRNGGIRSRRSHQLAPLDAAGAPSFEIVWDNVDQIHTPLGPRGSTHGVRLVPRRRGTVDDRRALSRMFGPIARPPAFGLIESDVDQLLALAPSRIPREAADLIQHAGLA